MIIFIYLFKPRPNEKHDRWYDDLTHNCIMRYISEIYGADFMSFKSNYGRGSYGEGEKLYYDVL